MRKMVNFTFTIVRHGVTDANQTGTIQGQLDVPLSDTGRQQAALLGRHLISQSFSHVFSSDLGRAKETSDLILNNFPIRPGLILDERLRERAYGVLQGQHFSLLHEHASKCNKSVLEYVPEGGESLQQLSGRVVAFFQDLCFALGQQFPISAPPTPRLLLCSSQPKFSRTSLSSNPLMKEGCIAENVGQPSLFSATNSSGTNLCQNSAKFYLDDTAAASEFSSSQDSGIFGVFNNEPLTIDTAETDSNTTCIDSTTSNVESTSTPVSPTGPAEWPPTRHWSQTSTTSPPGGGLCKARNSRKVSMQSIASDDSNFPDVDAQALIVTHGGVIRELFRYFADELLVTMPGGKGAALRLCPNTGFSTFFVSFENNNFNDVSVTCLNLHSKDHLIQYPTMLTGNSALSVIDPV